MLINITQEFKPFWYCVLDVKKSVALWTARCSVRNLSNEQNLLDGSVRTVFRTISTICSQTKVGLNDYAEYAGTKATIDELKQQKQLFYKMPLIGMKTNVFGGDLVSEQKYNHDGSHFISIPLTEGESNQSV